jgi:predicted RNA methylase
MSDNSELHDIKFWQKRLGLYPIPLFIDEAHGNQFVLVNGNKGNFCLDLRSEGLDSETRNQAWSSNVGHYVGLINGYIEVQRWDQRRYSTERYTHESVIGNLEKFHAHLEKDEPRRELSVVSHVIRVFRSLRTALGRNVDGNSSLKTFLYLLACVTDAVNRNELELDKWRLDATAVESANSIRETEWTALIGELTLGRPLEGLTPNPTLLLRHASGQIFQEAHYEAIAIPQQQMLEGFPPPPITLGKYSKSIGLHFTPPALARTLVEEALFAIGDLPNSLVIFDPACGSGEFLREALRQLKLSGYKGEVKIIGWDISQAACDMANYILAWEIRGYEKQISVDIRCHDSIISEEWPTNVNIVVMNPPFVSWQEMDPQQRDAVTEVLGELAIKRPDMSGAFIWRATSSLQHGGVLATILPASFLDGDSSEKIRGRLSDIFTTELVARLGSHQLFSSALIDAAFYVGRVNGNSTEPTVAFWADYRPHSTSAGLRALRRIRYSHSKSVFPVLGDGYNIYLNYEIGKTKRSWAPRPYESWELFKSLDTLPKVKDLFDVKQGALTGLNKVFILSNDKVEDLPRPERHYFRPAVLNESIRNGCLVDSAYVFYPHGNTLIDTEDELRKKVKAYYQDFLLPNKEALQNRAKINTQRWWELTRHRTWQEEAEPKLVTTYFGDAGSFARDSAGKFIVVQGYAWLHKSRKSFKTLPTNVGLAYLAILNSHLFSELLSATSNHVGGGQWNLSKRFVDNIPIPDLLSDNVEPDLITELSNIGKNIQSCQSINDETREELVKAVYGLS